MDPIAAAGPNGAMSNSAGSLGPVFGAVQRKLDRGRYLRMPASMRAYFSGAVVLSQGLGHSLDLWPFDEFDRYVDGWLRDIDPTSAEARRLSRFFNAGSFDVELDRRGRIAVPGPLRSFAEIEDDVVVVARGNHVELWAKDRTWQLPQQVEVARDPEEREELATAIAHFSDALFRRIQAKPELMHELSPRQFEELVAELYAREGFDVELTPQTRDGGIDIYVVQHTAFGQVVIGVECKKLREDRPVRVREVRELRGTIDAKGLNAGVIATTSRFTSVARAEAEQIPLRLQLQDYLDLQTMLNGRDELTMQ